MYVCMYVYVCACIYKYIKTYIFRVKKTITYLNFMLNNNKSLQLLRFLLIHLTRA